MNPAFSYSEAKLCERIGLSRSDAKEIRDRLMSEGAHWKKNGAGEIALSAKGLKRLWRALQTRPTFELSSCLIGKKNGVAVEGAILLGDTFAPIPIAIAVTRICDNPLVVLGVDAHRQIVSVWVGKNHLFSVGMKIKVVPKSDMPGFWRMAGPLPARRYTPDEWERRQRAGLPN